MKPFNLFNVKPLLCGMFAMGLAWQPISAQEDSPFDDEPELTKEELAELEAPKMIRTQLEFIEVKTSDMIELLYGEKRVADDSNLRIEMQKWLKDGKAKMFETVILNGVPGEIARVESIEELIYATEYEPSETPEKIIVKGEGDKAVKEEVKAPDLATPPNPTAFETRNVGTSVEVESTLSEDQKIVSLKLSPEIVYHVGYESWLDWKGKLAKTQIKMPIFYTLRFDTRVTLKRGSYQFVAAMSPKDDDGKPDPKKKLLVFVKADVLTVK